MDRSYKVTSSGGIVGGQPSFSGQVDEKGRPIEEADLYPTPAPTGSRRRWFEFGSGMRHGGLEDLPPAELWTLVAQITLSFILLICAACLAGFQSYWLGHPSGLTGFLLFVSLFSLVLSSILLALPLLARYKPAHSAPARFLREGRAGSILRAAPTAFVLFAAMAQAISTGTSKGCKNHAADRGKLRPGRSREEYVAQLPHFCASKVAGTVFAWFLLAVSGATLALFLWAYRTDRMGGQHSRVEGRGLYPAPQGPRDPGLTPAVRQQYGESDAESDASPEQAYDYEPDAYEFKYEPESEMDEYAYYASRYGTDACASARAQAYAGNQSFDYGAYTSTPRI